MYLMLMASLLTTTPSIALLFQLIETAMKPGRVFLDELNASTKTYKVKVKVIEKGRPKTSPTKGTVYQSIVIQDDKGNRMRGALFGDQVEGYKDAFVYNGTYEIANASVKRCDPKWKGQSSDMDFQMSFGNDTIIQSLEDAPNPDALSYKPISEIPRTASGDEKYDVFGIVVYIERKARKVTTAANRETFVREILVIDNCVDQPITISAWNELAGADSDALTSLVSKPVPVGFTALRVSSYRGFSLTTTMSTSFTPSPSGLAVAKLQEWASKNKNLLTTMHMRISTVKNADDKITIHKISDLLAKTVSTTLQEEKYWLKVRIPNPELSKIKAYIGCSICGKRNDEPRGQVHTCNTCFKPNSVACPRITFTCDVSDDTGTLTITAFNDHAESLLGIKAAPMFEIKEEVDHSKFSAVSSRVSEEEHLIQVGPKATLMRNSVLLWVLKKVKATKPASPALTSSERPATITTQPSEFDDGNGEASAPQTVDSPVNPQQTSAETSSSQTTQRRKRVAIKTEKGGKTLDISDVIPE